MPLTKPTAFNPRAFMASLLVVVALVLSSITLAPAASAATTHPAEQNAALAWLETELTSYGNAMPGFSAGSFDWGLTADAILALSAGGHKSSAATVAATQNLLQHSRDYATWDNLGDYPGIRVAGSLGKLLLVARVQGITNAAATDGLNLEAEVRATMETSGAQAGRFSDVNPHFATNNSNGFGQALAMLGLSYTSGGVPSQAVSFLLNQQCPSGGFRLTYGTTAGCSSDASSDTDATAMALQALLVIPTRTPEVHQALVSGTGWLLSAQHASGAWGGTGPTSNLNTNSTGLIAQTLRAAGYAEAANAGANWVASNALTTANAAGSPAEGDIGAIAYTPATRDAAIANGLRSNNRDQWRRATSQAVLALGSPDYGSIGRSAAQPIGNAPGPGNDEDPPNPENPGEDDANQNPNEPSTPSPDTIQAFITAAYQDFLGRAPTAAELSAGLGGANNVAARAALLEELARSNEWIGRIVTSFYQDTLGRQPDAGGLAYWVAQVRQGNTSVAGVAAHFYSSAEFFGSSGNTNQAWITQLYQQILGRAPDSSGLAYWVSTTSAVGRTRVAYSFYQSVESRQQRVDGLYHDLLNRQPDRSGRDYWTTRILTDGDLSLAVQIASSAEYAALALTTVP